MAWCERMTRVLRLCGVEPREYDGQPWGFFGQPAPIPVKTRTRSQGCGFPMGTGVGFHETHMSDVHGKEYIKMRFRPIKTRHGS
jgi:hypothetical protein